MGLPANILAGIIAGGGGSAALAAPPNYWLNPGKVGVTTGNKMFAHGSGGSFDESAQLGGFVVSRAGTSYCFYTAQSGGGTLTVGVRSQATATFTATGWGAGTKILDSGSGGWDTAGVTVFSVHYDTAVLGGAWVLYFGNTGQSGIGVATCTGDPTVLADWTREPTNPLLTATQGWENSKIWDASVAKIGTGDYVGLYTGNDVTGIAPNAAKIGLFNGSDYKTFTKYASNPVVSPTGSTWLRQSVFAPRIYGKVGSTYWAFICGKYDSVFGPSQTGLISSSDKITWTAPTHGLLTCDRLWEGVGDPFETEHAMLTTIGDDQWVFSDVWGGDKYLAATKIPAGSLGTSNLLTPGATTFFACEDKQSNAGPEASLLWTNTGTPTYPATFVGTGNCMDVSSANPCGVTMTDNSLVQMGAASFSGSIWIYPNAITTGDFIIGKNSAADKWEWQLWFSGGNLQFSVLNTTITLASTGAVAQPSTGAKHFVAYGYDVGQDKAWVSLDGGAKNYGAAGQGPFGNQGAAFTIGGSSYITFTAGSGSFQGKLKYAAVHKGIIMSDAQIAWLYNSGSGREFSEYLNAP